MKKIKLLVCIVILSILVCAVTVYYKQPKIAFTENKKVNHQIIDSELTPGEQYGRDSNMQYPYPSNSCEVPKDSFKDPMIINADKSINPNMIIKMDSKVDEKFLHDVSQDKDNI